MGVDRHGGHTVDLVQRVGNTIGGRARLALFTRRGNLLDIHRPFRGGACRGWLIWRVDPHRRSQGACSAILPSPKAYLNFGYLGRPDCVVRCGSYGTALGWADREWQCRSPGGSSCVACFVTFYGSGVSGRGSAARMVSRWAHI